MSFHLTCRITITVITETIIGNFFRYSFFFFKLTMILLINQNNFDVIFRRHRRYDHYRDDYDDYYYRENRSRPSSRTGSDYRRMNMDYYSGRVNARPMFYSDLVGGL